MNRSQRRAAVVNRSIAAGLLCVGFGLTAAAPALTDAGEDTGGAVASNSDGVHRGVPAAPDVTDANVSAGPRRGVRYSPSRTDEEWHPRPFWCDFVWPVLPFAPPLPYTGNRNGILAQFLPTPAGPPAAVAILDAGEHASTALPAPEAAAPAPAAAPEQPSGPSGPAPLAAALPAIVSNLPAVVLPPVVRPESVAPLPVPARIPDLPSTNLGQIAAVALPGLAGIAALTALGGFLGYRQAKAGYVLRAAGTARFLQ